jgi:group II intron reverse transcriptase/maturase
MEIKHGFKYRQLHIEDYLQEIPAEQGKVAGVYAHEWITGDPDTNANFWTDNLLDTILRYDNLNAAYKRVKANNGSGGIDGMKVDGLLPYLKRHRAELVEQLRKGKYKPNPVRRVEIPKEEKGKVRKLGIPTCVDRMVQQAISQELMPIFEEQFSDNSFGFRTGRSTHDAILRCKQYADEGYVFVVSMDLQSFFDTVNHSKLIEVLSSRGQSKTAEWSR